MVALNPQIATEHPPQIHPRQQLKARLNPAQKESLTKHPIIAGQKLPPRQMVETAPISHVDQLTEPATRQNNQLKLKESDEQPHCDDVRQRPDPDEDNKLPG